MSFNLATILTETSLATPDAPVHLFGGAATTYRQLDEQSGRLAAGPREAGLERLADGVTVGRVVCMP